jgi:hypothetical protein
MKKRWVVFAVLFGLMLHLQTLDNIYVGIKDLDHQDKWADIQTIKPDTLDYELNVPLEKGQAAVFFYNRGFGRIEYDGSYDIVN